ncbi:MAG: 4Fe-4S binding protein [Bacteroidales bacterium]|nr:4Fe-4S binding protein [Bacteroidales bacterium]MCF8334147.1 4Fe-4S binding protein [Bacteroidales bacterium]
MSKTKENEPLVKIIPSKCEVCYACVRACPVKAITLKVNQEYPRVDSERCIGCGDCLDACTPGAIVYCDNKTATKSLLKNYKTAAVVDPSISGEFEDITDYRKFVEMIRALGFVYVNEASFGMDLVARKYKELMDKEPGKYYITANCPAIFEYVEKYKPELLSNVAPIISPMVATAKVVRKRYGENLKVVFIGPCIDAKEDAKRYSDDGQIDSVITFPELRQLFKEYGVDEKQVHFSDFDDPIGYKGSLYPISKAFKDIAGIDDDMLTTQELTVDGGEPALNAVETFSTSINQIRHHFNLYYCQGCMMGPGTSPHGDPIYRRSLVTAYARKRLKDFDLQKWEKDMAEFTDLDYSRQFQANDQRLPNPPREKVQEVLKLLGKGDEKFNLSCGACGYKSCHELAESVANGIAKTDMCIHHSMKNQKDYIKTLKKTNEKLSETQQALKESEKKAREEQQKSQESLKTTSAVLQELSAGVVVVNNKLKIVQSNKRFINLMGPDAAEINEIIPGLVGADLKSLLPYQFYNLFSYVLNNDEAIHNRDVHFNDSFLNVNIFTIKKHKMVGAVIRDLQEPEVRKEEVINRVTEVIDQNLELVQQIGYILGEGASKTEQMLNSIIESYKKGDKK